MLDATTNWFSTRKVFLDSAFMRCCSNNYVKWSQLLSVIGVIDISAMMPTFDAPFDLADLHMALAHRQQQWNEEKYTFFPQGEMKIRELASHYGINYKDNDDSSTNTENTPQPLHSLTLSSNHEGRYDHSAIVVTYQAVEPLVPYLKSLQILTLDNVRLSSTTCFQLLSINCTSIRVLCFAKNEINLWFLRSCFLDSHFVKLEIFITSNCYYPHIEPEEPPIAFAELLQEFRAAASARPLPHLHIIDTELLFTSLIIQLAPNIKSFHLLYSSDWYYNHFQITPLQAITDHLHHHHQSIDMQSLSLQIQGFQVPIESEEAQVRQNAMQQWLQNSFFPHVFPSVTTTTIIPATNPWSHVKKLSIISLSSLQKDWILRALLPLIPPYFKGLEELSIVCNTHKWPAINDPNPHNHIHHTVDNTNIDHVFEPFHEIVSADTTIASSTNANNPITESNNNTCDNSHGSNSNDNNDNHSQTNGRSDIGKMDESLIDGMTKDGHQVVLTAVGFNQWFADWLFHLSESCVHLSSLALSDVYPLRFNLALDLLLRRRIKASNGSSSRISNAIDDIHPNNKSIMVMFPKLKRLDIRTPNTFFDQNSPIIHPFLSVNVFTFFHSIRDYHVQFLNPVFLQRLVLRGNFLVDAHVLPLLTYCTSAVAMLEELVLHSVHLTSAVYVTLLNTTNTSNHHHHHHHSHGNNMENTSTSSNTSHNNSNLDVSSARRFVFRRLRKLTCCIWSDFYTPGDVEVPPAESAGSRHFSAMDSTVMTTGMYLLMKLTAELPGLRSVRLFHRKKMNDTTIQPAMRNLQRMFGTFVIPNNWRFFSRTLFPNGKKAVVVPELCAYDRHDEF